MIGTPERQQSRYKVLPALALILTMFPFVGFSAITQFLGAECAVLNLLDGFSPSRGCASGALVQPSAVRIAVSQASRRQSD